jgi:NAD(P)-dependent dehydrogenase (short-subunit alcohol dehydrogenase family)
MSVGAGAAPATPADGAAVVAPRAGAPVLVVGASGILDPLARRLVGRGDSVVAVGRRPAPLEGLAAGTAAGPGRCRPLPADTTTGEGARRVGEDAGPLGGAVIYGPAVTDATLPLLLGTVAGRAVIVLTSASADPAATGAPPGADRCRELRAVMDHHRPRPADVVVLLGWKRDAAGVTGWHAPAEVSDAAARALDEGRDGVLGCLRPWDDRPGGRDPVPG